MVQVAKRKPVVVVVDLQCRDDEVRLVLKHGARLRDYKPLGKQWRTLRRGDAVRGPDGYEYTVKGLTLQEAEPPLLTPLEIESVAAWTATGLRR